MRAQRRASGGRTAAIGGQRRTDLRSAAEVDERPVVLLWAAEHIARLDVAMRVSDFVQLHKRAHRVAEGLHACTEWLRARTQKGWFVKVSILGGRKERAGKM
jgi:hypothetical protein